jgi:hypothetical protein
LHGTSVVPSRADVVGPPRYVRFVPIPELAGVGTAGVDCQKSLRADALEYAETRNVHERHYACQPEAGLLEQRPIFRIRSFYAPNVDQHL